MAHIELIGAPWCGTCKAIRKKLTAIDVPHEVRMVPPGPKGWEYAEAVSGRRALPIVLMDGEVTALKDFVQYVESLDLPERQLTELELDMIDDGDV